MIKGVIFDLDGVLVSTDELHYKAWKKLADELGIVDYDMLDNEKQRGISRMDSLEIMLHKSAKMYTLEEKKKFADKKNRFYQELLLSANKDILLPGVIELLKFLRCNNLKIAVGSSSKNALQVLKITQIERYIDAYVYGEDIVHSKPDPEIFVKAAKAIEIEMNLCIVVEDSEAGIEAAKRVGMRTVGVGPNYEKLKADFSARNLISIINWEKLLE